MLAQSFNHVLLLSFAHTIPQTRLLQRPCSHCHSVTSITRAITSHNSIAFFYHLMDTQPINHILLASSLIHNEPRILSYEQSQPSSIPYVRNHSVTFFWPHIPTQQLNHILLSYVQVIPGLCLTTGLRPMSLLSIKCTFSTVRVHASPPSLNRVFLDSSWAFSN